MKNNQIKERMAAFAAAVRKKPYAAAIAAAAVVLAALLFFVLGPPRIFSGIFRDQTGLAMVQEGKGSAVQKDEERRQVLRVYTNDATGVINPAYASSAGDRAVSAVIFEPLMRKSVDGKLEPVQMCIRDRHVDSPMHGEADSSVTGEQDPGAFARLDQPNEYLTDELGNRQKILDLTADGSKDKKPSNADLREYEAQLEVRRRKLAESGDVAHGAFVFSDYLPWVLAYDEGTKEDPGISIETYDSDGNPKALLDLNEARAQGWTIIDNTPKPKKGERDNRKFISITVIPPADQAAFGDRQSAYESIGNGKRPAGYLENGDKFTLKIRARVSDIPDVNKAENYDEVGMST